MTDDLANRVRARASNRCEYCQRPQSSSRIAFHIEHIIARQHGGKTTMGNLALSCPRCNFHKGSNIASYIIIKRKRRLVPLYNPRRHRWSKHFQWDGPRLIGLTTIGRATIHVLDMNAPEMLEAREALIDEEVFPPQPNEA
jgi:hypothetical protein